MTKQSKTKKTNQTDTWISLNGQEFDIYDWQYHKNPLFKKYFSYDKDREYNKRDFVQREMMRRALVKRAMERYQKDFNAYMDTDWENDSLPGGCSDDTWFALRTANEIIRNLHAAFLRLDEDD